MAEGTFLLWFRRDLRLADHPALSMACRQASRVLPVFLRDVDGMTARPLGGAACWWLDGALAALEQALQAHGSRLWYGSGGPLSLVALARQLPAAGVIWNGGETPQTRADDARLQAGLEQAGKVAWCLPPASLFPAGSVMTRSGQPFRVFTPYWRACLAQPEPLRPLPAPERIPPLPEDAPDGEMRAAWNLRPRQPDWAGGLRQTWKPGLAQAQSRLTAFCEEGLASYPQARDRPDQDGVSCLSPHLAWGEISPRQAWHQAQMAAALTGGAAAQAGAAAWLRELGWREFGRVQLQQYPDLATRSCDPRFVAYPWETNPVFEQAWRQGQTGYPIVDAGMRQLWATGWMHNRVRMIAGSFRVKDLRLSWTGGEAWFSDTLVDADPASNPLNWQWVAGCGVDAAPFFRIFNPVRQGMRFDPQGNYVARWVPELAALPVRYRHAPWQAPLAVLTAAGVLLGETYPRPLCDHETARAAALAAWRGLQTPGV